MMWVIPFVKATYRSMQQEKKDSAIGPLRNYFEIDKYWNILLLNYDIVRSENCQKQKKTKELRLALGD